MIKADKANKQPSERILRRSAKMKARLLQHLDESGYEQIDSGLKRQTRIRFRSEKVTEVEVKSDEKGKPPKVVSFHQRDDEIYIACFEKKSLKNCVANKFGLHCSHVERAIKLLLTEGESDVATELQK